MAADGEIRQIIGMSTDSHIRRSQSRMRGDYLYYEEKIEITPEEKDAKAARR